MEDEDDGKDLHDRGESLDEGGDQDLHTRMAREQPERPEHTQDAQALELPKHGHDVRKQPEDRDHHDKKVENIPALLQIRLGCEQEAIRDDLEHHLEHEERREDEVELVELGLEV